MSTRTSLYTAFLLLFLLVGGAHARTKVKVEKSAIAVSSPTTGGNVVVWGLPGSVYGAHPINVFAYNKDLKIGRGTTVKSDGSFSVTLPGHGDDDIKIKFTAANGKKKSVKLKVPETTVLSPFVVETKTVTEEVEVLE